VAASPDLDAAVARALVGLGCGEVVTYGDLARLAGRPGAARAVGSVMRRSDGLPWWRVVHADGRLVPGLEGRQARLLAHEGVRCRDGRVVEGGVEERRALRTRPQSGGARDAARPVASRARA